MVNTTMWLVTPTEMKCITDSIYEWLELPILNILILLKTDFFLRVINSFTLTVVNAIPILFALLERVTNRILLEKDSPDFSTFMPLDIPARW